MGSKNGAITAKTINNDKIESITVEEGCQIFNITDIAHNVYSLKQLHLQEGVTVFPNLEVLINNSTIYLETINIPSTLAEIPESGLARLSNYKIPWLVGTGVKTIGANAFNMNIKQFFTNIPRSEMNINENYGSGTAIYCKDEWVMTDDGLPAPLIDGVAVPPIVVTIELNGGQLHEYDAGKETQYLINGGVWSKPAMEPQKNGYYFDGYFKDSELTDPYMSGDKFIGNTTIYVKWGKLGG